MGEQEESGEKKTKMVADYPGRLAVKIREKDITGHMRNQGHRGKEG